MKGICQNCEKETELEFIIDKEVLEIRGEPIEVDVQYYKCSKCGEGFEEHNADYDPLDKAYREYRRRHDMLQPEEIKDLRKKYGLTQGEMSKLLGWGGATLSRYENGALQDETHEKALRLAIEPRNLRKLIERTPNALSEEKESGLLRELKELEEETYSFKHIYEERFGNYEGSIQSGYRKLDLEKLFNAILFFCKGGVIKTKIGKLLFYADFKHFQENTVSITGVQYARLPYGPVPDNFDYYYSSLINEEKAIMVDEVMYPDGKVGEKFTTVHEPDLTIFNETELKILAIVKEHFKDFTAKYITDFSHEENGYKETDTGHIISYDYADQLKL